MNENKQTTKITTIKLVGIPNAETISNFVRWEQSKHKSTTQKFHWIGNITTSHVRLEGKTRDHHNKATNREYRPKTSNKLCGCRNPAIVTVLILITDISKRVGSRPIQRY